MSEKQRTIKAEFSMKGTGLHTGIETEITFKPAPADFGYKFIRIDLEGSPVIAAHTDNVVDTSRGTVLAVNDARVSTVEHVLAALAALKIDNVAMEINGPEVPIMNGSSRPFVDALIASGAAELEAERKFYVIKEKMVFKDEAKGVEIIALPDDNYSLNVQIGFDSPFLRNQYAVLDSLDQFADEISDCRTFCFFREIEFLANNNLIKGGDLDNAIVFVDHDVKEDEIDRIANLFNKPKIKVDKKGVLNNVDLKYDNEPARHKLLDLVGDLALAGLPIKGKIIATHPGHKANVEFAKIIRSQIKKERGRPQPPKVDLYAQPVADIERIKSILPHRYPFLLVDKIVLLTQTEVVGIKNVTFNENFFMGHFPKESVMPGVLITEALAQCGGILVLNTVEDPENYSTYFMSIDKFKFRKKVVPGDILVFKLELITPIRRGIAYMKAQAFVGDTLAAEGELMAQIAKNL
jgi:UDP-3-O-[3-hydroxymyristoyl] N-acetylglucosamine deacetylase / 3-hydroxyacyl-[acyl-carrier-protein] dehydratase